MVVPKQLMLRVIDRLGILRSQGRHVVLVQPLELTDEVRLRRTREVRHDATALDAAMLIVSECFKRPPHVPPWSAWHS